VKSSMGYAGGAKRPQLLDRTAGATQSTAYTYEASDELGGRLMSNLVQFVASRKHASFMHRSPLCMQNDDDRRTCWTIGVEHSRSQSPSCTDNHFQAFSKNLSRGHSAKEAKCSR
jgi:hypothetical protein